jgi:hypothetical protein
MGLQNRTTGEFRDIPVATLSSFREQWLPLCGRLGLEWVSSFHDGSLVPLPPELIPAVIRELHTLAEAVAADDEYEWIGERIATILAAFAETDPREWAYDFG